MYFVLINFKYRNVTQLVPAIRHRDIQRSRDHAFNANIQTERVSITPVSWSLQCNQVMHWAHAVTPCLTNPHLTNHPYISAGKVVYMLAVVSCTFSPGLGCIPDS
jgi:hypothetical protein